VCSLEKLHCTGHHLTSHDAVGIIIYYYCCIFLELDEGSNLVPTGILAGAVRVQIKNRNPNPKDSTLNNLIGYSLTLAGASQAKLEIDNQQKKLFLKRPRK